MRALLMIACSATLGTAEEAPSGMVRIPGGEFTMGSQLEGARMNEQPVVKVKVDAYLIDEHVVTNAEFRKFTAATGYKTTATAPVPAEAPRRTPA